MLSTYYTDPHKKGPNVLLHNQSFLAHPLLDLPGISLINSAGPLIVISSSGGGWMGQCKLHAHKTIEISILLTLFLVHKNTNKMPLMLKNGEECVYHLTHIY